MHFDGGPPDGVAYNVFRNRTNGRQVCILTNSRMEARKVLFPGFKGAPGGKAPYLLSEP